MFLHSNTIQSLMLLLAYKAVFFFVFFLMQTQCNFVHNYVFVIMLHVFAPLRVAQNLVRLCR